MARAFPIDEVLDRVREAVAPFAKAAMFELRDRGHGTLFEQFVGCILSIRTFDEVSLPASLKLLALARTPEAMAKLTVARIDAAIRTVTFHEAKARQIREIARRIVRDHGGALPADREVLLSFPGVGPKCANLALGVALGEPRISVDIHVHRVTNRWGYVQTRTPEQTLTQLEAKLPRAHWVELNRLLVPFGKHVCTGVAPRCSSCPVRGPCAQVGVTTHR